MTASGDTDLRLRWLAFASTSCLADAEGGLVDFFCALRALGT